MTKKMAFLLLSGALITSSAVLAQSAGFIGNTIVSETPGLGALSFAVAEDGTYTRSDGISGAWKLDGDTLCFYADGQDDLCGPFDLSKQAGDSWEEEAWDGSGIATLSINPGLDLP